MASSFWAFFYDSFNCVGEPGRLWYWCASGSGYGGMPPVGKQARFSQVHRWRASGGGVMTIDPGNSRGLAGHTLCLWADLPATGRPYTCRGWIGSFFPCVEPWSCIVHMVWIKHNHIQDALDRSYYNVQVWMDY